MTHLAHCVIDVCLRPPNFRWDAWTKAGWNMTAQGKLYSSNKTEAERLMKVAGVELGAVEAIR